MQGRGFQQREACLPSESQGSLRFRGEGTLSLV